MRIKTLTSLVCTPNTPLVKLGASELMSHFLNYEATPYSRAEVKSPVTVWLIKHKLKRGSSFTYEMLLIGHRYSIYLRRKGVGTRVYF